MDTNLKHTTCEKLARCGGGDAGKSKKDALNNIRELQAGTLTGWTDFGHPCQLFDTF